MKYDDIVDILGGFGTYQKRLFLMSCLPPFLNALVVISSIFISAVPNYRCQLPKEFNDTNYYPSDDVTEYYVNLTIPKIKGTWSQCQRYDINISTDDVYPLKSQNYSPITCNAWVYDTSTFEDTFVTQTDMVCGDAVYRSHANMVVMAGLMVGSLVFGVYSDIYGRKVAVVTSGMLCIASSIALAFATTYWSFIIIRFVCGVAAIGSYMPCYVLGIELVAASKRTFVGVVNMLFWALGLFALSFLAYFIRSWQNLVIAIIFPCLLFFVLFWFMPESPRWLLAQGKYKKAKKILQYAAEVNKVDLHFDEQIIDLEESEQPKSKIWEMFTSPVLFIRSLIIFGNWIVITMVFYGLGLNIGNLGGDIYLNFTISNVIETVGYLLCLLLLDKVGRKVLLCTSMLIGGIACICTIFPVLYGSEDHGWIIIALSMVGKLGASASFAIIYVFTVELFPTVVRNSSLGVCSFLARIGGIVSPYIADLGTLVTGDLGTALPLIVFGSSSVVTGLLSLFLPETLHETLPETIDDAKYLGRKSRGEKYDPVKVSREKQTYPDDKITSKL